MVNETALLASISSIPSLVDTIKTLIGGIFGIYLILLFLRWKESRNLTRLMKDIRYDMRKLAKKMGVKETSEEKKGFIRKKIESFKKKR